MRALATFLEKLRGEECFLEASMSSEFLPSLLRVVPSSIFWWLGMLAELLDTFDLSPSSKFTSWSGFAFLELKALTGITDYSLRSWISESSEIPCPKVLSGSP